MNNNLISNNDLTSNKMTKILTLLVLVFGVYLASANVFAHGKEQVNAKPRLFVGMSSEAAHVVKAFHRALQTGNEDVARKLLADDVLIFEGGRVERSAGQYASHHMKSDINYMKKLKVVPIEHQVQVFGDTAVSMYRAQVTGKYKNETVDRESMETLVLKKHRGGNWKIINIHWSS